MPSEPDCESRFIYDGSGGIHPKDSENRGAQNIIEKLNLEDSGLSLERKKVVQDIEERILQSGAPYRDMVRQIRIWCAPDADGRLSGFAQVAHSYFEGENLFIGEE